MTRRSVRHAAFKKLSGNCYQKFILLCTILTLFAFQQMHTAATDNPQTTKPDQNSNAEMVTSKTNTPVPSNTKNDSAVNSSQTATSTVKNDLSTKEDVSTTMSSSPGTTTTTNNPTTQTSVRDTNGTTETSKTGKKCNSPKGGNFSFMILYIIVCAYSFIGITITCHHYFLSSLVRICEELRMSQDVVGATFMAAGSSAPELATVIIAVFFTQDDIGISDVIGSAVFNLMFVNALCGFLTTREVSLNWWPLFRNCFFYTVSVLAMIIAIYNGQVNWFESLMLLLLYVVYCLALYYNSILEAWVYTLPLPFHRLLGEVAPMENSEIPMEDQKNENNVSTDFQDQFETIPIQSTEPEEQEAKNEVTAEPFERPPPDGPIFQWLSWAVSYPIHYACRLTVPDCRREQWRNSYVLTFIMSLLWISFYSFIMMQMITLIGVTLGIPDTVMGLTLVAAGVSVPDAITSIGVVRKGYGDMGISNSVGSNIFDILICLGLPWFLKTAIISPGTYVTVYSRGMVYSTLLLFCSVGVLLMVAHFNKWKINRKFGIPLMVGYFLFIIISTVAELLIGGLPLC